MTLGKEVVSSWQMDKLKRVVKSCGFSLPSSDTVKVTLTGWLCQAASGSQKSLGPQHWSGLGRCLLLRATGKQYYFAVFFFSKYWSLNMWHKPSTANFPPWFFECRKPDQQSLWTEQPLLISWNSMWHQKGTQRWESGHCSTALFINDSRHALPYGSAHFPI